MLVERMERMNIPFILGEKKNITLQATSHSSAPIVITSATWELKRKGAVVSSGNATIDSTYIKFILQPQVAGTHELIVTCQIGGETKKLRAFVNVEG